MELGLPVLVVVQELDEATAFAAMIREGGDGWSLFELGTSFTRALDDGLFASRRKLAEACGLTLRATCIALEAASLPEFVVQALSSPNALTARAVAQLAKAVQDDAAAVEQRAKRLLGAPKGRDKAIVAELLGSRF